jgi:hypothetical protein
MSEITQQDFECALGHHKWRVMLENCCWDICCHCGRKIKRVEDLGDILREVLESPSICRKLFPIENIKIENIE